MARSILMVIGAGILLSSTVFAGAMLKPGDAFPAWELPNQNGTIVSSKDYAGKTYLLYFYPKAMTSGCTTEGCALRDNYTGFEKAGVLIVGVSFDKPAKNAEFAAKYKFPFPLLSDTERTLAVEVGAADSPSRIVARRISYLVGPDGKVLEAYSDVTPSQHATQVLADLERLQSAPQ
jgi:thioredoxin-dependent peroxiredoxin